MQPTVEYLGYRIDAQELHAIEKKVKAIRNAPAPENQQQLRSFLGMINYYSKFISNRPIANMATISPKRDFSVATVARVWLPVLTSAVAGKTAASQASFPLNSTKISHFSSLKEVSIWYVRFEYCFSMLN